MENLPQHTALSLNCSIFCSVWNTHTHTHIPAIGKHSSSCTIPQGQTHKHYYSPHWSILLMFSSVWLNHLKPLCIDVHYIIKTLYWWFWFTPFSLLIDFLYLPWFFRPKGLVSFYLFIYYGDYTDHNYNCCWAASQSSVCVCVLGENWNTAWRRQRVQECCRVDEWNRDGQIEKENWYLDIGSVWCHEMPAVLVAAVGFQGALSPNLSLISV